MKLKRDNRLVCVAVIGKVCCGIDDYAIILLVCAQKSAGNTATPSTMTDDCCGEYDEDAEDIETEARPNPAG